MSQSRKRTYESADDSGEKKGAASDTHMAPSDQRVFTVVWKKESEDNPPATLLTAKRAYFSDRNRIIVYDTVTRQEIKEIATGGGRICDISQSRDGKSLFVACHDTTARIIDLATEKEVVLRGHTRDVRCIIQGEGIGILTCSYDKTIRRWNSSTGECLMIYEGHTHWANSILYDEATKRIFSASGDNTIIAWNGETGEKIGVMEGHRDSVRSLALVNSTTIASGSDDKSIKLWDTATLARIKTISTRSYVVSIAAAPDGQHLITGSADKTVKVWSIATGQCLHTLSHHNYWVWKVAISPDGRFIASDGYNATFLYSVSLPFPFLIYKGTLARNGREESLSLFSDGAIRGSNGDLVTFITYTTTCSYVSDAQVCVHGHVFSAPSAQLWSEAICAVAADLALHPDDRARSADQMIRRYRFNLLQTILVHLREPRTLKWHIPREIVQIIRGYNIT